MPWNAKPDAGRLAAGRLAAGIPSSNFWASDARGVNQHHLEQIQISPGGSFKPNLAHLEELSQVRQMTPAEYREAWAWVHLLLRDKPEAKAVLTQYLQQLRVNPNPGSLV